MFLGGFLGCVLTQIRPLLGTLTSNRPEHMIKKDARELPGAFFHGPGA